MFCRRACGEAEEQAKRRERRLAVGGEQGTRERFDCHALLTCNALLLLLLLLAALLLALLLLLLQLRGPRRRRRRLDHDDGDRAAATAAGGLHAGVHQRRRHAQCRSRAGSPASGLGEESSKGGGHRTQR